MAGPERRAIWRDDYPYKAVHSFPVFGECLGVESQGSIGVGWLDGRFHALHPFLGNGGPYNVCHGIVPRDEHLQVSSEGREEGEENQCASQEHGANFSKSS